MKFKKIASALISFLLLFAAYEITNKMPERHNDVLEMISAFDGEAAYSIVNNNIPDFSESDMVTKSYEQYSRLDYLGRCGEAMACVGRDIMPTEERESIGQVKPSGWKTAKYDIVDGKYLYNRCHLIGYQLTGENANEQNLITGTRYMNVEGMLPFENLIADYVKETGNHVIYRVTPVFEGNNLLSSGVQMEAKSVEDDGEGVCFNVYVYNVQPGIGIDYSTGESWLEESINTNASDGIEYVLNTKSKKIHLPLCSGAQNIKNENKTTSVKSREDLIKMGYVPCGECNP